MSSISFDRAADEYDATRGYSPATADAIGAALFQAAGGQPGSRFLEIGIGTGRIAIPLLALGADVTGVDIAPRMVERLHTNLAARRAEQPDRPWGALDVRIADMTALPFADETFDAVVAVHVLHLVPGWRRALDEALRVLRSGGALLVGQDRYPGSEAGAIQERWATIMHGLGGGHHVEPVGATGYRAVVEDLRGRGLAVTETSVVGWTERVSPQEVLDQVARRTGSRTWRVPDDLFAASLERLAEWAREHYGATLDTPREEPAEFLVAKVVKPA
jgi:SAM-dependent methyltransferase